MKELNTNEKAEMVAEKTIEASPQLNATQGSEKLKNMLAEKLTDSHERGDIDLDKFLTQERERDIQPRSGKTDSRER